MRAIILGCGGAAGVPSVSFGWGNCDPTNQKNRRLRPSILVEDGDTRLLVDTSPDLREQLLRAGINRIDAVLYTHDHADHLHGIDDIREINRAMGKALPVWATKSVLATIAQRFPYVFEPLPESTSVFFKPLLWPNIIESEFRIGSMSILSFDQDHGFGQTTGFRFGKIAYSTDVVDLPSSSFDVLSGVDTWIVGCMVDQPHPTHAHVDKILTWVDRLRPRRTIITHMGSRLDYCLVKNALPSNIEPAFDGMIIDA